MIEKHLRNHSILSNIILDFQSLILMYVIIFKLNINSFVITIMLLL